MTDGHEFALRTANARFTATFRQLVWQGYPGPLGDKAGVGRRSHQDGPAHRLVDEAANPGGYGCQTRCCASQYR